MIELFKRILSIFDFRLHSSKKLYEIIHQSDEQALRSDWEVIGNDFKNILGHYK